MSAPPPTPVVPPGPTRTCPRCKMAVPAKAHVCAYCKKRLRTGPVALGCAAVFALFVILVVVISNATSSGPSAPAEAPAPAGGGPVQKAGGEPHAGPAGTPAGTAILTRTEDFPATTTHGPIHKRTTQKLPVFANTEDCGKKFTIVSVLVAVRSEKFQADLSPKVKLTIRKEFAGYGAEPEIVLCCNDPGRKTEVNIWRAIDKKRWLAKGYTFTVNLDFEDKDGSGLRTFEALKWSSPESWKYVALHCASK